MISKLVIVMLMVTCGITCGIATCKEMTPTEFMAFGDFLEKDKTNNNTFINGSYECLSFTIDLIRNATKAGYDIELVHIAPGKTYKNGHYIIGLMVEYIGLVLIEPQTDEMIQDALIENSVADHIVVIAPEFAQQINHTGLKFQIAFSKKYDM